MSVTRPNGPVQAGSTTGHRNVPPWGNCPRKRVPTSWQLLGDEGGSGAVIYAGSFARLVGSRG